MGFDTRDPKVVPGGLHDGYDAVLMLDSATFSEIYDDPSQHARFFFSGKLKVNGKQEALPKFFDLIKLAKQ
ncbi:hypothetical protein AB0I53_46055 [Saccharopolyspora sp. NPDC050389]|uniref:hypothetical protein n=1 Tax=Saccharopolyspora sp. NPDC050389 TaxID=3155516 RepID=UPI0033F45569